MPDTNQQEKLACKPRRNERCCLYSQGQLYHLKEYDDK